MTEVIHNDILNAFSEEIRGASIVKPATWYLADELVGDKEPLKWRIFGAITAKTIAKDNSNTTYDAGNDLKPIADFLNNKKRRYYNKDTSGAGLNGLLDSAIETVLKRSTLSKRNTSFQSRIYPDGDETPQTQKS
jgi:hypothetical protein